MYAKYRLFFLFFGKEAMFILYNYFDDLYSDRGGQYIIQIVKIHSIHTLSHNGIAAILVKLALITNQT